MKRVLIIDDNEQDRKGMILALRRDGYPDIAEADSEEDGLLLARAFRPDVVIVDVVLPANDGFDVCQEIKKIDGLAPKVIVITGHLEAVKAAKARVSGADEIIEKQEGFKNIHPTILRLAG